MINQLEKGFVVLVVFSMLAFLTTSCQKTVTGRVIFEDPESEYRKGAKYPKPSNKEGPPPWASAHGYRAKYKYHYYPSSYVYYSSERRSYFYQDNRGWRSVYELPSWITIEKDDYVILEMDTHRPYEFHSDVIKKYPPGQKKIMKKDKNKGKEKSKGKWKYKK